MTQCFETFPKENNIFLAKILKIHWWKVKKTGFITSARASQNLQQDFLKWLSQAMKSLRKVAQFIFKKFKYVVQFIHKSF